MGDSQGGEGAGAPWKPWFLPGQGVELKAGYPVLRRLAGDMCNQFPWVFLSLEHVQGTSGLQCKNKRGAVMLQHINDN